MKEVMVEAWRIVRTTGKSIREALRLSWANLKLRMAMLKGVVRFVYTKLSTNEKRVAYGTLNPSYMPEVSGEGSGRRQYAHLQTYWDAQKQGWRAFCKAELVIE